MKKATKKGRPTIGVLLDFINEGFQAKIWNGIYKACEDKDINLLCFLGGPLNIPEKHHAPRNLVYNLIKKEYLDGLIITSATIGSFITNVKLKEFIDQFSTLPKVSIGVEFSDIPSILVNNQIGMEEAIEHLIVQHGLKNLAFIKGTEGNPEAEIRLEYYKNVLNKHNIKFNPDLILPGNFYFGSGTEAVKTLLDERKIKFDGIIASNDIMAIDALNELKRRNISIPYDVAVIGYDDITNAKNTKPSLTTVNQPLFEVGYKSVETLYTVLNNQTVEFLQKLPSKLVIRRSCGCFSFKREHSIYSSNILTTSINDNKNISKIKEEPDTIITKIFQQEIIDNIFKELTFMKAETSIIDLLNKLILSLKNDIENSKNNQYLKFLDKIIPELQRHNLNYKNLKEILSITFKKILFRLKSDDLKINAETLWNHSQEIITESEQQLQNLKRLKAEEKSRDLHIVSIELITTFDLNKLQKVIMEEFPKLGIDKCYLLEYIENKNQFKTLVSHDDDNILPEIFKNKNFKGDDFFVNLINKQNKQSSFIIMTLYFKEEHLGFAVFDAAKLPGMVYETLAIQLSGTIKGAGLLENEKKYSVELEKKVMQRTSELKNAYNQLEEANKQKTIFFINLAHETKTPLTLIKNYLEKYMQDKKNDKDLNIIKNNIDKLLRDMVNYLDIEKLSRNQIFYNNDNIVNVSKFMENKILLFNEIARKKMIFISSKIENDLYIKIDPCAMDRIINNLLDNSIKYTTPKGSIFVALNSKNNEIILKISDTGLGFTEEQKKYIFNPFHQISHKKRNIQGIGMGLNIVKKILDSIEAKIEIDSKLNAGSTFNIYFKKYLPKKSDNLNEDAECSIPMNIIDSSLNLIETAIMTEKHSLLLVDDNVEMLSFLQSSLKDSYNVFLALNGMEAYKKLEVIPRPDLIISDIMMDEMNGHEFFNMMKSNSNFIDIPFIFLTAKSTENEKLRGLKEGAIDYIYKPFSIDELKFKINAIIQNSSNLKKKNISDLQEQIHSVIEDLKHTSNNENNTSTNNIKNYRQTYEKYNMTKREIEITELIKEGLINRDISEKLNISSRTVEFHIHNIYKKLGVQNRIELLNFFKSEFKN